MYENKSCITINCGYCGNNAEGETTGCKEAVLYDGLINTVGTFNLTDDINNYDDIYILHETSTGECRQCLCMPVKGLGTSNLVCHGDSTVSTFAIFSIDKTELAISAVRDSYRIVKIIGRKY